MRVPIRVGFPASGGDLLGARVKSVAEWAVAGIEAASSDMRGLAYRCVRTVGLPGSATCHWRARRQCSVKFRQSRSPRALLVGIRAAVGVGLVPTPSLPGHVDAEMRTVAFDTSRARSCSGALRVHFL